MAGRRAAGGRGRAGTTRPTPGVQHPERGRARRAARTLGGERSMRHRMRVLIAGLLFALLASACSLPSFDEGTDDGGGDITLDDPGDCIVVDMAVSPEKIDLLTD